MKSVINHKGLTGFYKAISDTDWTSFSFANQEADIDETGNLYLEILNRDGDHKIHCGLKLCKSNR